MKTYFDDNIVDVAVECPKCKSFSFVLVDTSKGDFKEAIESMKCNKCKVNLKVIGVCND